MKRPLAAALVSSLLAIGAAQASSTVYKWVDEYGTVHLSTTKPPAGVRYETLNLGSAPKNAPPAKGAGPAAVPRATPPTASPEQVARRSDVLSNLKERECVLALEALDRLTSGTQPTSAAEIARLKQTAEQNCSRDPAQRREQEEMAAKLRVANGPDCVAARNKLAEMMAPGAKVTRDQLRAQQAFVDGHCIPPVQ